MRLYLFAVLLWFMADQAQLWAAQVSYLSGRNEIVISGEIVVGDHLLFQRALTEAANPSLPNEIKVVLSGPGGDLIEALRIIELITHPPKGVMISKALIPPRESCISACAFIFMHGGTERGAPELQRQMDYTSVLGFHAPWLKTIGDRLYSAAEIAAAFSDGQNVLRELMAQKRIPLELVFEFLDEGPDEFYSIDTVYKATRWQIGVIGYADPAIYPNWYELNLPLPTAQAALWVCAQNYFGLESGSSAVELNNYLDEFLPETNFFNAPMPSAGQQLSEITVTSESTLDGFELTFNVLFRMDEESRPLCIARFNSWGVSVEYPSFSSRDERPSAEEYLHRSSKSLGWEKPEIPVNQRIKVSPLTAFPPGLPLLQLRQYQSNATKMVFP
jgi:hypothetical protein